MEKTSLNCRYISAKAFVDLCQDIGLSGGVADSPFGPVMIRMLGNAVCGLGFMADPPLKARELPIFAQDYKVDSYICQEIIDRISQQQPISILLAGTAFQHQVWHHLQHIKPGQTISYQGLAKALGDVKKTRAVASAIARNPVSWLIPCHRVIPKDKGIGHYLWGSAIKDKLLKSEGLFLCP